METFLSDGAPIHCVAPTLRYLGTKFPTVLSRWPNNARGVVEASQATFEPWPPRSPDLSACDHWLWGRLKGLVYAHPMPRDVETLKRKILAKARELDPDEIRRSVEGTHTWAQTCIELGGMFFFAFTLSFWFKNRKMHIFNTNNAMVIFQS